ncbi:MAG TPA: GNAT family protein [Jatrophihabitans sp.]|nr:GNAT family protein [Jatrophihabitans sp.]
MPEPAESTAPTSHIEVAETHPDRWWSMPCLSGNLVRLRPLAIEDAQGLHSALWADGAGDEVFRWLGRPAPRTEDQLRETIHAALAQRAHGERLPYAQVDARTGELIGTTSYYDVAPAARTLAIGHTWLGRRWWRTGHNTESKLLMLGHAFDGLGAVRVVWHTDMLNERSRSAISRLGARFEGELRKHRLRADGSWRDSAQFAMLDDDWPANRERLTSALERS